MKTQKESLEKYCQGLRKLLQACEKCVMIMKESKKQKKNNVNNTHVKMLLVEGGH